MKDASRIRALCLSCLLSCCLLGSACGARTDGEGRSPQVPDLPPVAPLPGTGIISHEHEEQEVLPRMTRVASLPRGGKDQISRTAAGASPEQSPAAQPAGIASPPQGVAFPLFPVSSVRTSPSAALPPQQQAPRPAPVIHDDIVPPAPEEWRRLAREAEEIFGLDAGLVLAVIQAESSFDHTAISPVGAQGAMQIMPRTQEELGLIDPFDPRANVYAGSQYLMHQLERFGSVELALAAYNAGPASVEQYGGIPPFPETQEFVRRVLLYRERHGAEEPGGAS